VKFILPLLLGGLAVAGIVDVVWRIIRSPARVTPSEAFIILAWSAGVGIGYWLMSRPLKRVSVDDRFLYVSNYLDEVAIPLSDIASVKQSSWSRIRAVTIRLKSPTSFGNELRFMAKAEWKRAWKEYEVVDELRRLADLHGQ
jgi:hypothetical protein